VTRALVAAALLVAVAGCRRDGPRELPSRPARPTSAPATATSAPATAASAPATAAAAPAPASRTAAVALPTQPGCPLSGQPWRFPAVPRLIALGDLHGDLSAARAALGLAGAVDDRDRWIGGALWVVQTGDILDRGDDEQAIVDWFERLEREADAAGGRFVWMLGNHEIMNAAGDLRYVTAAGLRDFDDVPGLALERVARAPAQVRARLAAFLPGGPYAKILAGQHYVTIVGDTVFVHGGIAPGQAAGLDVELLAARCWLDGEGAPPDALEDDEGPLWNRAFAREDVDCAALDRALRELGVARMVVGHTVQEHGVTSACDGKVWRIDVGMSAAYGGPRQVIELTASGVRVLGAAP